MPEIIWAIIIGYVAFTILGTIVLTGVRSWRTTGNLSSHEDAFFIACIPISWIAAPIWFWHLVFELTGVKDWWHTRYDASLWNEYDKRALEAAVVPSIASKKSRDYYGHTTIKYWAVEPRAPDPRKNPEPAPLPSVHRVRELMAITDKRNYIDIPKSEAEHLLKVYRVGARDARIEELENELRELK